MASKATVTYVFRRPRFPVICAVDGGLIAARSPASFQRQITRLDPPALGNLLVRIREPTCLHKKMLDNRSFHVSSPIIRGQA